MKIIKKKCIIQLGHAETKIWESGTPEGYDLRRYVHAAARKMACKNRYGEPAAVEIFASASRGGWTADIVEPSES